MLELPQEMRDSLLERLDDFFSSSSQPDAEEIADTAVRAIRAIADDLDLEGGEGIVARLEASGELESSLDEVLQEAVENLSDFDYTGEEVLNLIERLCEIDWTAEEDEDDDDDEPGAGFFDDDDSMFKDDDY